MTAVDNAPLKFLDKEMRPCLRNYKASASLW